MYRRIDRRELSVFVTVLVHHRTTVYLVAQYLITEVNQRFSADKENITVEMNGRLERH